MNITSRPQSSGTVHLWQNLHPSNQSINQSINLLWCQCSVDQTIFEKFKSSSSPYWFKLSLKHKTFNGYIFIQFTLHVIKQVKGTVSRDFRHSFYKQKLLLGTIWTGKNSFAKFFVFAKKFAKNVCPHSPCLCWHGVSVVVDFADTMSAWSLTSWTPC